jgi:serpin B
MNLRAIAPLGTLALALALAGACSSSTDGTGGAGGGAAISLPELRSQKAFDPNPNPPSADVAAVVAGSNQLGFDLFAKLPKGEARLLSPASISAVLSMLYPGARKGTAKEIGAVLHDGIGVDRWSSAYARIIADLGERDVAPHVEDELSKSVTLRLLDAACVQKGNAIEPAYLDTLSQRFDTGVKVLDFAADPDAARGLVNGFVSQQSHGKIDGLLGPGSIDALTRLVLVNVLYFKGSWQVPFDEGTTSIDPFHAATGDVQASTMHGTIALPYVEGAGFKATELPYDGGQLALTIVLPDEGKLAAIEAGASADWLAKITTSFATSHASVALALPKFTFSFGSADLSGALRELGMASAFQPGGADFTGIDASHPLVLQSFVHQAYIGVDEKGAEAAAATATAVGEVGAGGAGPEEIKPFVVDRPFLFLLRDVQSGAVLFLGEVLDPTR